MTQYNFTTNIEKRMPTTGDVFFVDRMTSDYAQAHPFDVDAFIESVFQKWQDCETIDFRETREALRRQWDKTLGECNPRGNVALYPNKNCEKHPALIEVWLKAGDYWRRGLRLGDVLPAVTPGCKITRTEDGWIALFQKDLHLLEQQADQSAKPETEVAAPAVEPTEPAEQEQPEATAAEQQEATAAEQQEATVSGTLVSEAPQPDPRDEEQEQQRERSSLFTIHSIPADAPTRSLSLLKPLAVAAASVVACVVIYETGLLIPLGLIGLGMGGLIK